MMMSRVLVVEDDPVLRWLMTEAVEHLGYDVTACANAEKALDALRGQVSLSLVITDVRMPGSIDGLGLAQIIWLTRPALPVVIASGHCVLAPDFLPGNARFLKKPYTLSDLSNTLEELLMGDHT